MFLKQSTTVTIQMGPALDASDGVTEETALSPTVEISKANGAFAARNSATAISHDANGWYRVELNATDTNTLGRLVAKFDDSATHIPVWHEFTVLAANVYDSLIAATDNLEVDTTLIEGADATDQINAAADTALTDYDAVVPADLPTNFADLAITVTTGQVTVGTNNDKTGYSISGTKTTLDALNDVSTADVNAQADQALTDYDAPTYDELLAFVQLLARSDAAITTDRATELSAINANEGSGVGDYAATADSQEALRDRGDSAWATAVGFSTHTAADVRTEMDSNSTQLAAIVADTNELQTDDVPGLIAALNDPTAATIADAVWDEAKAGHVGVGSFGEEVQAHALSSEISALNDPTAAAIRAEIDSNSTQLAAIVADTNELQTDWANGGRLDLILDARAAQTTADAIETDTQDIQSRLPAALVGGRMDSDVSAISTSTDAADKLEASAETIETGAAQTGTLSTTQMTTNLTEATDDHYIGRVIIWTSGVLLRQATDITDYDGASKMLTYTAVTEAPSNGDTFIIV